MRNPNDSAMLDAVLNWAESHEAILWWMFVASIVTFFGTLLALPVLVSRIPVDYFKHPPSEHSAAHRDWTPIRVAWHVVKNLVGAVIIAAGVAMLVLPGQGILTILIGIMLLDFPGKYAIERGIVRRPRVLKSINWMRKKAGRPPLVID